MALGISDLVNSITGSINNLLSSFSPGGADSNNVVQYHQGEAGISDVQSTINKESWSKLLFPYTFAVVNIVDASKNGSSGFKDFELPLAPQTLNQKEEPAIAIRPTQGGTTVNHSGLGYKTLQMSGTTGIAPFRGDGGVRLATGEAIGQPDGLKFKSGYEVFLHLRNWFRSYYEWKRRQGKDAADYRMIFKNYKDGEFLIVELISFEMDRNASKSFLYDYKIEFKVLAHYTFNTPGKDTSFLGQIDSFISGALDKINTARGVMLRTQGVLRQIESTYDSSVLEPLRATTLALKAFLGVPLVAADIGTRAIANTVSTAKALSITATEAANFLTLSKDSETRAQIEALLDKRINGSSGNKITDTMAATQQDIQQNGSQGLQKMGALLTRVDIGSFPSQTLDATAKEQNEASSLPRSFFDNTIAELERVKKNAEDFFNLGDASYDALFDRTATLNADPTKTPTDDEYAVLYAFNEAMSGLYLLLSTTALFKSSFDARIQDMITRFDGNIDLSSSQACRQVILDAGITLERLALKELGDSTRWGEIVELNGLKAPYISEDPQESRDGVLKVGSKILIPAPVINGFSQAPNGGANKLTTNMSEVEKSLGVDFKLDENFDLVLGSTGDFELIAGAENMAQGTVLKLTYEPGDLILHPEIGAGVTIGNKFPPLQQLKDRITNSLMQDVRVNKVSDLALVRESSGLMISFNLFVKNVDIPIPVKIKV